MNIPSSLLPHIARRKPKSPTTITVRVAEEGRRKVEGDIDAAYVAYCRTDGHNMIIFMVDGTTVFTIHDKSELVDILKSVSNEDLVFFAVGKFYIVNLKHITGVDKAHSMLFFGEEDEIGIKLSRDALKDFFRQVAEASEAEEIRKAEKQTVYVQEESTRSSAPSGMRGWVGIAPVRYREVQEYIFEDDKAYLI